ncbi:hypothetical protein ES703_79307 [subsurface metagenome]
MKSPVFSFLVHFPDPNQYGSIGHPEGVRCPMCASRWFTDYEICEGVITVVCHECGADYLLSDLLRDNFNLS